MTKIYIMQRRTPGRPCKDNRYIIYFSLYQDQYLQIIQNQIYFLDTGEGGVGGQKDRVNCNYEAH